MHRGAPTKGESTPLETGACSGWLRTERKTEIQAGRLIRLVKDK